MEKFYRVCNEDTMQGLWYDERGNFTGLIHNKFDFCKNSTLEMDFDEELVNWLSAVSSIDELYNWFSKDDIKRLQEFGYYIFEYDVIESKFYEKFQHMIINKHTSRPSKKIVLL